MSHVYKRTNWLADVLRAEGLRVKEHADWKTAGRPESEFSYDPRGVMWHHDASAVGDSPGSPSNLLHEQDGVPPPRANCWVARSGTWHVLASGKSNHAGDGGPLGVLGLDNGNTDSIGVETDHTKGEVWPDAQLDSMRRGTAAILKRLDAKPAEAFFGHKEYAPKRKIDPDGLDMADERTRVVTLISQLTGDGGMTVGAPQRFGFVQETDRNAKGVLSVYVFAHRRKTTGKAVMALNGIGPFELQVGHRLRLP